MAVRTSAENRSLLHNKMFWGVSALLVAGLVALLIWLGVHLMSEGDQGSHDGETGESTEAAVQLKAQPDVLKLCDAEKDKMKPWDGENAISKEDRDILKDIDLSKALNLQYKDMSDLQNAQCPQLIEEAKVVDFLTQVPPPTPSTPIPPNTKPLLEKYQKSERLGVPLREQIQKLLAVETPKIQELSDAITGNLALSDVAKNQLVYWKAHENEIPASNIIVKDYIKASQKVSEYVVLAAPPNLTPEAMSELREWLRKYSTSLALTDEQRTKLESYCRTSYTTLLDERDALLNDLVDMLGNYNIFDDVKVEQNAARLESILSQLTSFKGPYGIVLNPKDKKEDIIKHAAKVVKNDLATSFEKGVETMTSSQIVKDRLPKLRNWFVYVNAKEPCTDPTLKSINTHAAFNDILKPKFKAMIEKQIQEIVNEKNGKPVAADFTNLLTFIQDVKMVIGNFGDATLDSATVETLLSRSSSSRWFKIKETAVSVLIDELLKPKTNDDVINEAFASLKQECESLNITDNDTMSIEHTNFKDLKMPTYTRNSNNEQQKAFLTTLAENMLKNRYDQIATDADPINAVNEYLSMRSILVTKQPDCITRVEYLKKVKPNEILKSMAGSLIENYINNVNKIFADEEMQKTGMITEVRKLSNNLIDVKKMTDKILPEDSDKIKSFNKIKDDPKTAFDVFYEHGTAEHKWSRAYVLGGKDPSVLSIVDDVKKRYIALKGKAAADFDTLKLVQLKWEFSRALRGLLDLEPVDVNDFMKAKKKFMDYVFMATVLAEGGFHSLDDALFADLKLNKDTILMYFSKIVDRLSEKDLLKIIRSLRLQHDKSVNVVKFLDAVSKKPDLILLGDLVSNSHFVTGLELLSKEAEMAKYYCLMLNNFDTYAKVPGEENKPPKSLIADYVKNRDSGKFYTGIIPHRRPLIAINDNLNAMRDNMAHYAKSASELISFCNTNIDSDTKKRLVDDNLINSLIPDVMAMNAISKMLQMDLAIQKFAEMDTAYGPSNSISFDKTVFTTLKDVPVPPADNAKLEQRKNAMQAIYEFAEANAEIVAHIQSGIPFKGFAFPFFGRPKSPEDFVKEAKELRDLALKEVGQDLSKANDKLYFYNAKLITAVTSAFATGRSSMWATKFKSYLSVSTPPDNKSNQLVPFELAVGLFTIPQSDYPPGLANPQKAVLKPAAIYIAAHLLKKRVEECIKAKVNICDKIVPIDRSATQDSLADAFVLAMGVPGGDKHCPAEFYFLSEMFKLIKEKSDRKQFEVPFISYFNDQGVPSNFNDLPTLAALSEKFIQLVNNFGEKCGIKDWANIPPAVKSKFPVDFINGRVTGNSSLQTAQEQLIAYLARNTDNIPDAAGTGKIDTQICKTPVP